jgi:acyl carrier protein
MTQSRAELVDDLRSFLLTLQRHGRSIEIADENDELVGSGYIDSLAVVQIVSYLEAKHRVDFGAIGLDPDRLSSISSIVDLIMESKT